MIWSLNESNLDLINIFIYKMDDNISQDIKMNDF